MKKKLLSFLVVALLLVGFVFPLAGCVPRERTLRILSWGDYIDIGSRRPRVDSTMKMFENHWRSTYNEKIKVVYDEVETNEDMYNKIQRDEEDYDLICVSDYLIEQMIAENLLLELDMDNIPNASNISAYITGLMDEINPDMQKYGVGYMWGTMGILYNTAMVTRPITKWADLWDNTIIKSDALGSGNSKHNKGLLMKDSVRDSYFAAALAHGLNPNATDKATVDNIWNKLIDQRALSMFKGYEIDAGKGEMVDGTAAISLQWAGDAILAIEEAAKKNRTLEYVIPEEGGNVFFDAFVVPKFAKNKLMAERFINFLCREDIAIKNMDYIGYTSCVATEGLFDEFNGTAAGTLDVSYFFGTGKAKFSASDLDEIQYPDAAVISDLILMRAFLNTTEAAYINQMWLGVRGNTRPTA